MGALARSEVVHRVIQLVTKTYRVAAELLLGRLVAFHFGQPADAMALQAAVQ